MSAARESTEGVAVSRDAELSKQVIIAPALARAILEGTHYSCVATDASGVIKIFNAGAERLSGYTAAEVLNTVALTQLQDADELVARAEALSIEFGTTIAPGFEALVFKAARGMEDTYELTTVRKDGSRFRAAVSVSALHDPADEIIGYLLIGDDNSPGGHVEAERLKLVQQLRDEQLHTRSLIESNVDALITTDAHGIITDVNRPMESLTGSSRDQLIGSPFKSYFTDVDQAEAAIRRALVEGTVIDYELTAQARGGAPTVVSCNATTIYHPDGTLQGVLAVARDVTEQKRCERMLQQKNEELEDASRLKSEFLANMSHELRTPLNAIIGFSETLRDGLMGAVTDQQRRFISDIFDSGKHLLALIDDILDLSRVEAGFMTLNLESLSIASLLRNSFSIVQEKGARHGIRLELEIAEDLGVMRADRRQVKQIVYKLLANAVKFTPGGQVRLRAAHVGRTKVGQLSNISRGRSFPAPENEFKDFLEITVIDSGIGISPEKLQQLFEPFRQVETGLARHFGGAGLGLVMVKRLAELHGGTVAVESDLGEGSCFTVWLPLRNGET